MIRRRDLVEGLLLISGIVLAALLLHQAYRKYMSTCYPNYYEEQVLACAEEYSLSPSLLMAVIYVESHFETDARSSAGATGLMQLTDSTFEWAQIRLGIPKEQHLSPDQLCDPTINIQYGSYVLRILGEEFPVEDTVLAAYNAGIGNVREWLADMRYSEDGKFLKVIPFTETREYVQRVRAAQKMYQRLYAYP